jgi:hypothetical protein
MIRRRLAIAGILMLLGLSASAQESGGRFIRSADGKTVSWNVTLVKKWEYRVKEFSIADANPEALQDSLNKLGEDGWELVWCNQDKGIFKRPKQ